VPRLVVVLPLLPLRIGDGFPLRTWPLHVTVAPTFVTDAGPAAVAEAISTVVAAAATISVTAGGDEGFGPSGRVPVTVLVRSPELSALHALLLQTLSTAGAVFDDPEYTGPGYRAHVTVTAEARMRPGDVALLEQAALVDMEPVGPQRWRRVVWVARLNTARLPPFRPPGG
jgi:2'-5' RNA ligase